MTGGNPITDGGGRGDGFAPPAALLPFAREAAGLFLYDAGLSQAGNGPPLLLLHGNGDEADSWRRVLPGLSRHSRVVAPDLPGFGRSAPQGAGGLEALSGAVVRLLEELDLGGVRLVGSSLGAAVAVLVALAAPGRVAGLVLVGGGLPHQFGAGASPLLAPGVGEAFYNGLREQGQEAAYATLRGFYADLGGLPAEERAFLRERVWARVWSDRQRDAFLAALRSLGAAEPLDPARLAGMPLRLIWGERDAVVPLRVAHELRSALPQARLSVIPGAGHLPQQERPDEFLEALLGEVGRT
ncbi:MAG: alpha/beta fold hydrolase [Deinococcus sp.]